MIPSVVVVTPLLAISFKGDQKWWMYVLFSQTGGNLGSIVASTISDIRGFIDFGNFRPIGRLLVDIEHAVMFDTAIATGIPPHVIHGLVRLAMVVILAAVATRFVRALCRPAAREPAPGRAGGQTDGQASEFGVYIFPVVLAVTLVAADSQHPLVFFPFWSMLSIIAVLGTALVVASDRAIGTRWSWRRSGQPGNGWGQLAAAAGVGAALSMIYELVYVAPAVGTAMVVARRRHRQTWRDLLTSVAAARLAGLTCGLGMVVLLARLAIMVRCATEACLGSLGSSSAIAVSGLTHQVILNRVASGLPWVGWARALDRIQPSGSLWTGDASVLSNSFSLLMVALILGVGLAFYREAVRPPSATAARRRSGLGMLLVGGMIVTLPALMISATETVQNSEQLSGGGDWRDTLFVQIGWAIVVTGVLQMLLSVKPLEWRPWLSRATIGLVVLVTLYSTIVTYQVNYAYSRSDHQRYGSTYNNLVATAIVNFDTSSRGDSLRCSLVDNYLSRSDSIGMVVAYDWVAKELHDRPFCSRHTFGHWNGVFVDDDHSPYERENEILLSRGITSGCSPAGIPLFCPDKLVSGRHLWIFLGRMAALGMVEQRVADSVDPTGALTRAHLTRFLVDSSPKISPIPNPEGLFSDIEDVAFAGYAEAVYRAGVYQGCSEHPRQYCPDEAVSRDELAGFLVRIFEIPDA